MKIINFIIKDRYDLTSSGSLKKTKHIVLELKENIEFFSGDSIGIYPTSNLDLAKQILKLLKDIPKDINGLSAEKFLVKNIDLENLSRNIISLVSNKHSNNYKKILLKHLLAEDNRELLKKFIKDYSILNFMEQYACSITFEEFTKSALAIFPRLYSIASSPKKASNVIDLVINVIEYETPTGKKMGLCSKFISDVSIGSEIRGYIQTNAVFRLPNENRDIIMISNGTGIAPFRAFIQERELINSSGKNWLFFGEQTSKNDFYYETDLKNWVYKNILKLDTAFSRDKKEKNYVQHLILEKGKEIFKWIEKGAYIYICGSRDMGKEVDNTIYSIIRENLSNDHFKADEYIKKLRNEKRYLKDVY